MMAPPGSKPHQRLDELRRIVREVDSASDLESALGVVVRRTREVMEADVCTVYFTDEAQRRHVIVATDGLSSRVVGRVQFDFGKGLIGQLAESSQPVNLDRVPPELDQGFVLQAGAGRYQGFLGVPVTHKGRVQGVLVVRQRAARRFDDADEAFLSTLAAQLGGAIAYAKASGELGALCRLEAPVPRQIDGLPGAPGIAIGHGALVYVPAELDSVPDRAPEDPDADEAWLRAAIRAVREGIAGLGVDLAGRLTDADRALFDAYVLMLDSPEITETAVGLIRQGSWAPGAVRQTIETYARRFEAMEDPYLRERADDIRALGARILARLLGGAHESIEPSAATVLVGRRVSAIDIGQFPAGRLVGVVSADGSSLSHASIVARALGIPAVMGIGDVPLAHLDGQELIVDGGTGRVHVRPDDAMRRTFEATIEDQRALMEALEPVRGLDACTADGVNIALFTNAGMSADLDLAAAAGSAGIGLFRSELPFMLFDRFPSELEQLDVYRRVLETVAPLPVNLRTVDAGGDKPLPYLSHDEPNPALGWRGIRFSLDHPEIFLTQLRAALRADIGIGNLRLLLPMLSGLDEVEQALEFIDQASDQLLDQGLEVSRPPVGVMIEVPAAVYQAESLARRVDFLSVGTNDLTQYLLATDRNNPRVSTRLDPAHPALLQALQQVVEAARRAGKPVTVCGEMAGDPVLALLLLGMGFDGLSMSPAALPRVKWAIRKVTVPRMRSLAEQALLCERPEAIRPLLVEVLREVGLESLAPGYHRRRSDSLPDTLPAAKQQSVQ
jgi:phosphotransferase system enzyme I (PtsP)